MQDVTVLDEPFTPPPDFDALAYLRSTMPEPAAHDVSVWLAVPPEELRGHVSGWHTELSPEDGGTRMRAGRDNLRSFAAFLLGLDCDLRVDGPPELRRMLARLGERGAALGALH